MTPDTTSVLKSAADMRRQFDSSFATPQGGCVEDRELIIVIRVSGELLAVRAGQITGVSKLGRIASIPAQVPAFLGIASARGELIPVYDLAALLGLSAPESDKGWMICVNCDTPIGLVFERIEAQMEVACACIYADQNSNLHDYLRQIVKLGKNNRAVIDIPGLVAEIRKRTGLSQVQRSNS